MAPIPRRQHLLYQKIVQAVVMHQRTLESVSYIFIITLSIDLISTVFYSILQYFLNSFIH